MEKHEIIKDKSVRAAQKKQKSEAKCTCSTKGAEKWGQAKLNKV